MSLLPEILEELESLMGSVRDECVTEQQVRRLDDLLETHPEAQRFYADYIQLCCQLRRFQSVAGHRATTLEHFVPAEQTAVRPSVDESEPHRPRRPAHEWFSDTRMALAAAIMLIASLTVAVIVDMGQRSGIGVGVLVSAVDATWDHPTMSEDWVGLPIQEGRLRLKSGVAQIEFHSGAVAVFEGPADFTLHTRDLVTLDRGKVRTYVPPRAEGFTILAPDLRVVDLGTEFGLSVPQTGPAEVHVFDGFVEVEGTKSVSTRAPKQTIRAGKAVQVTKAGAVKPIAADDSAFIGRTQMESLVAEDQRKRLGRWQAQSASITSDPATLLFMDFDGGAAQNLAGSATSGRVVGARTAPGRFPGGKALDFGAAGDRVEVNIPGSHDSLSYSAWVFVRVLPHRWTALLLTDGWDQGEPHWQIRSDGRLILGVQRGGDGSRSYDYVSIAPALTKANQNRWVHVATVYNGASQKVAHFLNGQRISTQSMNVHVPLVIGRARIGAWDRQNRTFNGAIDDVALFSRALSDTQIQEMYTAGKPNPQLKR